MPEDIKQLALKYAMVNLAYATAHAKGRTEEAMEFYNAMIDLQNAIFKACKTAASEL